MATTKKNTTTNSAVERQWEDKLKIVKNSVSSLKDEMASIKGELNTLRTMISRDMKRIVEHINDNG
jgi:hypothetical protein